MKRNLCLVFIGLMTISLIASGEALPGKIPGVRIQPSNLPGMGPQILINSAATQLSSPVVVINGVSFTSDVTLDIDDEYITSIVQFLNSIIILTEEPSIAP